MSIINILNTPPTPQQTITIILFIFSAGFIPVWLWWSKEYVKHHPLTDWLNIITSASVLTIFVVLPLLQIIGINRLYTLSIFPFLLATFWRYMQPQIIDMNNLLQMEQEIEFPEFEWIEGA